MVLIAKIKGGYVTDKHRNPCFICETKGVKVKPICFQPQVHFMFFDNHGKFYPSNLKF